MDLGERSLVKSKLPAAIFSVHAGMRERNNDKGTDESKRLMHVAEKEV